MSLFGKRMKEARLRAGLSQEKLGVLAGIDEMSSSARMNQYERGKHEPDFSMVERIALALDLPESFFFSKDDKTAWLLVALHRLPSAMRYEVIDAVDAMIATSRSG